MWARIADDIATHYGLDGLGIESLWGRDLVHPSGAVAPTPMGTGVCPGLKWPGVALTTHPHVTPRLNSVPIISLWSLHELF